MFISKWSGCCGTFIQTISVYHIYFQIINDAWIRARLGRACCGQGKGELRWCWLRTVHICTVCHCQRDSPDIRCKSINQLLITHLCVHPIRVCFLHTEQTVQALHYHQLNRELRADFTVFYNEIQLNRTTKSNCTLKTFKNFSLKTHCFLQSRKCLEQKIVISIMIWPRKWNFCMIPEILWRFSKLI